MKLAEQFPELVIGVRVKGRTVEVGILGILAKDDEDWFLYPVAIEGLTGQEDTVKSLAVAEATR